jgi:alpha-amylase/alpha-mannosidase (GH57 family)
MSTRSDERKQAEIHLVLHGHFYQPPRENPWLEEIEREPSAHPYPNWNARIAEECYRVNGWARVFDDQGRVEEIANNYQHLSFNFGPTLLSWLCREAPQTYARILEADRRSAAERSGHGNAIAQAYGHAILPLCNPRDRLTQIRWGVRDFRYRFGREPEALWLPETAVDAETVEDLIAEGMRYLILAPRQARRVRPLAPEPGSGGGWRDVSGAKIDPRAPYRLFSRRDRARFIDAFFYDGPISHAISFERVLDSSRQLVDKLWGGADQSRSEAQLVHSAVDGETFGHHMRHAERALSYAFVVEARRRGFQLTNYGEYLDRHPPREEVELEPGPEGEGTSWSCAHGVGRWCRDCGCNAGAPAGWNQAWRAPLRAAVNLVRDEAASLFEEQGAELLRDVWAARDDYVELLLDGSGEARERFLERHGREGGRLTRQVQAFKLLELQRHSLLAQTSCGWFFDDISGLEAVQVLRYAARTVQLMEELSGRSVERRLLETLSEARSNLEEMGTGADVYRRLVLPSAVGTRRLVALYAITDMFHDHPDAHGFFGHQIERLEKHRFASGPLSLIAGRLQVEHLRTGEHAGMTYALIHFGGHDFHCAVRPFAGIQEFRDFSERMGASFDRATITELLRAVDAHFGETYFGLRDLLPEEREDVLAALFGHLSERFAEMYTRLYQENRRAVNALVDTGLKLPREFRLAAEYTLSRQLNQEVRSQKRSRSQGSYRKALEIAREASLRGYLLELDESREIFGEMLVEAVRRLVSDRSDQACGEAREISELAEALELEIPLDPAQDLLYQLLRDGGPEGLPADLPGLLERLRMAPRLADPANRHSP